jgi:predicted ATPase
MITKVRIQNYKALRDVTLELTPIHVLIGPNDSGKTSILEAIAALCRSVDHDLSHAFLGAWKGKELFWQNSENSLITIQAELETGGSTYSYELSVSGAIQGRTLKIENEVGASRFNKLDDLQLATGHSVTRVNRIGFHGETSSNEECSLARALFDLLHGVHIYRWDARFLALPVAPDSNRRFRMEPTGFGLALCLDDILGYDRELFTRLEDRFRQIFPDIKSIKLIPEPAYKSPVDDPEQVPKIQPSDGKGLYFEFIGSKEPIPARQVSDGVLLVLAYLAVLYQPHPPRVLLVEEPENGIHPQRIKDVLGILRDIVNSESLQTQLVLTTHSPYVVDLFDPSEVTLCKKGSDGATQVQRLSESKTVSEQMDIFTLGEIWTAEGDNALLSPLISGGE